MRNKGWGETDALLYLCFDAWTLECLNIFDSLSQFLCIWFREVGPWSHKPVSLNGRLGNSENWGGARKSANPSPTLCQPFANPSPTFRQLFANLFCQPLSNPLFPWTPGTRLETLVNCFLVGGKEKACRAPIDPKHLGIGMFQEDGVLKTSKEKWNRAHLALDQLINSYAHKTQKSGLSCTKLKI